MDPTQGQASLQDKMGQALLLHLLGVHIQWEAHAWDWCVEDAPEQAKKAEEKRLVQPVGCHFHLEGGSAETKLS